MSEEAPLVPILVDGFGRDGTTLTMQLLGTAPEIAFDRIYPYEQRYLSYLLHWSRLPMHEDWEGERWNLDSIAHGHSFAQVHYAGPLPWTERSLIANGHPPFWRDAFEAAWESFSQRARATVRDQLGDPSQPVLYYAQKSAHTRALDFSELPPMRLICLLRDPRDTWVSSLAFHRRREAEGDSFLPIGPDRGEREVLEEFIFDQRERLRWLRVARDEMGAPVIRFESLIDDLPGETARLGGWLGVRLDAEAVLRRRGEFAGHITAASVESSRERWREELTLEISARFWETMGAEMADWGFEP